jgi:PleD family two-component response regulator
LAAFSGGRAGKSAGAAIQQMMEDADAKLYYGKRHGKNQVVSVLPTEPAL